MVPPSRAPVDFQVSLSGIRYSSDGVLLLTWNPASTSSGIFACTAAPRLPVTLPIWPSERCPLPCANANKGRHANAVRSGRNRGLQELFNAIFKVLFAGQADMRGRDSALAVDQKRS